MSNAGIRLFVWDLEKARRAVEEIKLSRTVDEAVERVRKALDWPTLSYNAIQHALKRQGLGSSLVAYLLSPGQSPPLPGVAVPSGDAPPPPAAPSSPRVVVDLVEDLLEVVNRRPVTFEEVCDDMGLPPGKLREVVEDAQARGYRVELLGGHVGIRPTASPLEEHDVPIARAVPRQDLRQRAHGAHVRAPRGAYLRGEGDPGGADGRPPHGHGRRPLRPRHHEAPPTPEDPVVLLTAVDGLLTPALMLIR